jgi:metal-responsive CopG/Arc/MetJ family transcriptional regulator
LDRSRRIIVNIPESLLNEIDAISAANSIDRSTALCQALHCYIQHRKMVEYEMKIKACSKELYEINVAISEMCREVDNEQLYFYEEKLWELEKA